MNHTCLVTKLNIKARVHLQILHKNFKISGFRTTEKKDGGVFEKAISAQLIHYFLCNVSSTG